MKKGKIFLAFILCLLFSINVNAQSIFVTDEDLIDSKTYNQSMFRFGNNVDSSARIDGLNVTFGNDIKSNGKSDYAIYFGNIINFNETVEKDVFLFASNINVGSDAKLGRDAYLFASNVKVNSNINGNLRIGAEEVDLSGIVIKGNVSIYADEVNLTDTKITGNLKITEDAKVIGATDSTALTITETDKLFKQEEKTIESKVFDTLMIIVRAIILASIILYVFPKVKKYLDKLELDKTVKDYFKKGILLLFLVPIISLVLLILFANLFIGISLLLISLYIVALFIAKPFVSYILGRYVFKKFDIKINDYLALVLSIVGVYLVCLLPVIGSLLSFFIVIYFLGLCYTLLEKLKK